MQKTILIVEDDHAIAQMIIFNLENAGFLVLFAENGKDALDLIAEKLPDLILLDWMIPYITGIQLAKRLKRDALTCEIPIILLTARSTEDDKIQGLEACDDYITKPFSPRELIARVKVVLRRGSIDQTRLTSGTLQIDTAAHRVTCDGQIIDIASIEYRLLLFFMTHADRVYSRSQILDQVWGSTTYVEERTIDVHIKRLRHLLLPYGHAKMIQTVRGSGYRFSAVK